jgi:cytosine/adenosine deaminase-related metal-dependent hydrolase
MVTVDAAAVLMLPRAGELRSGAPADLLILPAGPGNPIANVPEATRSDIRLVMIDGLARIGDADMSPAFTASGVAYVEARLDGRTKLMSRRLAERIRGCRAAEPGLEL